MFEEGMPTSKPGPWMLGAEDDPPLEDISGDMFMDAAIDFGDRTGIGSDAYHPKVWRCKELRQPTLEHAT